MKVVVWTCIAFVRWYAEEGVSLDSAEEEERLGGLGLIQGHTNGSSAINSFEGSYNKEGKGRAGKSIFEGEVEVCSL